MGECRNHAIAEILHSGNLFQIPRSRRNLPLLKATPTDAKQGVRLSVHWISMARGRRLFILEGISGHRRRVFTYFYTTGRSAKAFSFPHGGVAWLQRKVEGRQQAKKKIRRYRAIEEDRL